jgi:hypothetical protein
MQPSGGQMESAMRVLAWLVVVTLCALVRHAEQSHT